MKQPNDVHYKDRLSHFGFEWDSSFGVDVTASFERKQKFIDSECIRLMENYTPFESHTLIDSVEYHTKVGSGLIVQKTPYARYQYYNQFVNYSNNSTGLRGSKWFERMKIASGKAILRGAEKIK